MPKAPTKPTARKAAKKHPPPTAAAKAKIVAHTDDGVPIVNATLAQIRKGGGKAAGHLVRIPQGAERGLLYRHAAEVIGERESLALPYHGGRLWRCEVKVSDEHGACGDNRPGSGKGGKGGKGDDGDEVSAKKKSKATYKAPTPLFRWYRGSLILATLPYILEDVVEVECQTGKKRWANGLSDDELDSSDEEWAHEKYQVTPTNKMTMEVSALTEAAKADASHPLPHIGRSWISPDLQRFGSRKAAIAHSDVLMKRDALIDRILYGYGHGGVRLRPIKPTRKMALEAGMARFLRDGLWIVGQEEMWIEQRRDALVRKQDKRRLLQRSPGEEDAGPAASALDTTGDAPAAAGGAEGEASAASAGEEEADGGVDETQAAAGYLHPDGPAARQPAEDGNAAARAKAGRVHPGVDSKPAATSPGDNHATAVVSPSESDASTEGVRPPPNGTAGGAKGDGTDAAAALHPRAPRGAAPPPAFVPSTHYRLNRAQIDQCFAACIEHYQRVMYTVRARSLQLELADGFDVLRERGRGRYDMAPAPFDAPAFAFLTDPRRAPWMPVVRRILGEGATLVHKGCFLSLPGSDTQVYHQDGVHLNRKTHKPAHAINVFVPLVDYDTTNGPTEFCLGTHYLGHENFVRENVYTPCVAAGTPVIFDYRLGHRGLRNSSRGVRPVVYLTYSSVASGKEFRDAVNFSTKRYRKLGDFAERPPSREERAQKRRRQEEE